MVFAQRNDESTKFLTAWNFKKIYFSSRPGYDQLSSCRIKSQYARLTNTRLEFRDSTLSVNVPNFDPSRPPPHGEQPTVGTYGKLRQPEVRRRLRKGNRVSGSHPTSIEFLPILECLERRRKLLGLRGYFFLSAVKYAWRTADYGEENCQNIH